MKILIAGVASSGHLSGISRHAANLARCLLTIAGVTAVDLVIADWQYESLNAVISNEDNRLTLHCVSVPSDAIGRNVWYYKQLPALAARFKADIVHLAYPAPVNRSAIHCPVVVTLHDLYPYDIPSNFGFAKVMFNRVILQQCLRAVDTIACVSETTFRRLAVHAPRLAERKAVTVYNCVDPKPFVAAASPLPSWNQQPFILCVAQHRKNKNIVLALQIFRRLLLEKEIASNAMLVIIGIQGPETQRIHRAVSEFGLEKQVIFLEGIDDAQLEWCYKHCELLLAPSVIEGFGLPVVEAMFHHCRVVCSDIPAFREVGGSYCHYVPLEPSPEEAFVHAASLALNSLRFRTPTTDRYASALIAKAYFQLYTDLRRRATAVGSHEPYALAPSLERGQS
jgi:glycosyltransferase involved in cell wall biosynthesis